MADYQHLLNTGLQELKLTLNPSQQEQLLAFIALIYKWNKTYNLTAIKSLDDMVGLHVLDSLAVLPYLQGQRTIDVATGAGLPGIPLAIACPDKQFVLLDSNSKKTRFVQQAVLELKLANVQVIHARVEEYQPELAFDSLTCRAFTQLNTIIELTKHLLNNNGIILAMKAQPSAEELAEIKQYRCTIVNLTVPFIQAQRCLVKISC